jgi:membrane-associated protease RseP (regulator of RpoE activity)
MRDTDTSWRWRGVGTTAVAVGALFATVVGSALAVLSAAVVYAVAMATDDPVSLSTLVGLWLGGAVAAVALSLLPAALVVRHFGGGHRVLGPVVGVAACLLTWTVLSVTSDHPVLTLVAGPVAGAVLAGGTIRPRLV